MDTLDDDEGQSNSSDEENEEIYESNDDESEFANEEKNKCANEDITQGSKNTPRSTKIKSLVDINSDILITKDGRFLQQNQSLLLRNDTSNVFNLILIKCWQLFPMREKVSKNVSPRKLVRTL